MVDLSNVVDAFLGRNSKQRNHKDIDRILELLGGGEEKKAEEESDLSPGAIVKLLKEEHERKQRSADSWNKAFEEAIAPHLLDHENFKPKIFFETLFSTLKKRLGRDGATRYIDDLASYVIKHLDVFIRRAHGTGSKIQKEPFALMPINASDENFKVLKEGTGFLGQVVNKDPSQPHMYEVRITGPDLAEKLYRMDTSTSLIELKKNHKYKMRTTGAYHKGRLHVLVPDAQRGELFMMALSDQVPKMLNDGVRDFLETEYKEDIGKVEHAIKKLEDRIRKLDEDIKDAHKAGNDTKVEELEKEKEEALSSFEQLTKMGIPEAEKFVKEERHESPFKQKILKYESPFEFWTKYHPPEAMSIEQDFNEDDIAKTRKALGEALKDMHGDYKGLPYNKLAEFLMEAIYSVPVPSEKSGWHQVFLKKVEEYIAKEKSSVKFNKDDVTHVIKEIQKVLLKDERFKNLRENLLHYKMRGLIRHAFMEDNVLKRTVDQIWDKPITDTAHLTSEYRMLEELKVNKEISPKMYRDIVEEETVSRFRKYLEPELLQKGLDIAVAIGDAVGKQDFMVGRLKKLFLTDLWQLEEDKLAEKIKLFNEYMMAFPVKEDVATRAERDRVYKEIATLIEQDFTKVAPAEEKSRRRPKKVQELEKVIEDKPIEKIIRDRDPDLMKELENLF
jgi:hypothetical protein